MFNSIFAHFSAFCDAAEPWQLGFQDPASPVMQGLVDLHHDLMFSYFLFFFFVLILMVRTLMYFHSNAPTANTASNVVHGTVLEIV